MSVKFEKIIYFNELLFWNKPLIGDYVGTQSCMIYNNEETCFCKDGYYGKSCEYNYQYDQNTNITIGNCEKTNCLNGYFLYIFFFHFYFD